MQTDHYILSYVNLANGDEKHYGREFETMIKLMAFVNQSHEDVSSYQIIVVRK